MVKEVVRVKVQLSMKFLDLLKHSDDENKTVISLLDLLQIRFHLRQ